MSTNHRQTASERQAAQLAPSEPDEPKPVRKVRKINGADGGDRGRTPVSASASEDQARALDRS
ncbi:hypothetical protein [Plantibacter sp. ME-Dv--P-095]|uniref:hypothetical protein n=1 Tax=Plantibacter sp. ME-Dv--P-095 TaxID=3040299 RepID=UPI00254E3072|nr:hypothetical protein [Plantibacter sp. ME-Dv--P-095]